MRIVLIRNAETIADDITNGIGNGRNIEVDPEITCNGKEESSKLGIFLKENGFKINKFFSSPRESSISTTQLITNNYNSEVPVELLIDLHEFGGIYDKTNEKIFRGLNRVQILEKFPNILIGEESDIDNGWWKEDSLETEVKFFERVKRVILKLKEMAGKNEEDYTVCLITHCFFINSFFSILTNTEVLMSSKKKLFTIS